MKLFLKGERCYGEKCSYTRRPYPPGQHGQARVKLSEYAIRLREKQKVRRIYGVLERQFQRYYLDAARRKGRTGEQMLGLLESRLDNVVHRLGFAFTRAQARQLVRHGHVLVNGKSVDIPSVILRAGDKVEIGPKSREIKEIAASLAQVEKRAALSWLDLDKGNFAGVFKGLPVREEMNDPAIREQYVVEYYSR
jgi:small subunit ribosomal protein S4